MLNKPIAHTSNKASLADAGYVAQILDDVANFISVVSIGDLHVRVELLVDGIERLDKHSIAKWLDLYICRAQEVLDACVGVVLEILVTDDSRIFHLLQRVWNNVHPGAVAPG